MPRTRTFIAIGLDDTVRDHLVTLQETLGRTGAGVKWVTRENMHLTLLFLGEVDNRELVAVCRAVAAAAKQQAPFRFSVEGVGCFPNARRPRIVWAGVGTGKLEVCNLHDLLEPPLLELGCYRREERQYTPHLTLGRVAGDGGNQELSARIAKKASWQGGEVAVREVLIMSSELTADGPLYTVLGRGKLGVE